MCQGPEPPYVGCALLCATTAPNNLCLTPSNLYLFYEGGSKDPGFVEENLLKLPYQWRLNLSGYMFILACQTDGVEI